jgi:hypothetical protein
MRYDDVMLWYDPFLLWYDCFLLWYDGFLLWYDGFILGYDCDMIFWCGYMMILYEGHMEKRSPTRYPVYALISYSISHTGYIVRYVVVVWFDCVWYGWDTGWDPFSLFQSKLSSFKISLLAVQVGIVGSRWKVSWLGISMPIGHSRVSGVRVSMMRTGMMARLSRSSSGLAGAEGFIG